MRNHGFILSTKGWKLSPAYDLNPSIDKDGLAININADENALDYELAKSVGKYFQLNEMEMNAIIKKTKTSISKWQDIAREIGISRNEQLMMKAAFKF